MNVKTLIEQVDLVDYAEKFTDLSKQGDSYRGVCPVCKHDNNSEFQIYDHKTYHCWACGSSGDVINLIKDMNSVDFYTAVEMLADELNVDIEQDKGYKERKEKVSKRQQYALENHKNVKTVKDYLTKERGLSEETIEYFKLGADQRGNVTIPFVDVNGRYVGSAIRRFEGTPKYLTNRNDDVFVKAEFLYNMRGAKEKLTNRLYLVEGFFCAMSLWQNNFAGVAYNSSQPSKQHLQQIGKLRKLYPELTVTLVPDNDGVAYPLVEKVRKNILRYAPDLPVEILLLPEGIKDVNDYFVAGHTAEEWENLPTEPIDLFVLKTELDKCSSILAERAVVEAFVKTVSNNLMLLQIGEYLSERWKQDKKAVNGFLDVSQEGECLTEDFKDPEQCTRETLEMLKTPCVSYGVPTLDEGIRGAGRRKDVTFIGGYSSSGKTLLTICMAVDMVVRQRKKVIYFSMEMSAGALYERVLAYILQRPSDIVDEMLLAGDELVYNCLEKLKEHLYVIDKNGLTIGQVDAYIKDAKARLFDGELDCVFIDYIQYMKGCAEFSILAETAKGMKPLAKENNIHVVVLSQLNRGSRIWEKPTMADMKGGGDLEASADNILLIWRPDKDPALLPEEAALKRGTVMVAVGKARNGAKVEEVEMYIDGATSRIRPR